MWSLILMRWKEQAESQSCPSFPVLFLLESPCPTTEIERHVVALEYQPRQQAGPMMPWNPASNYLNTVSRRQ